MVDKLKFAFEKFFALVTSQRTVGTLVGLALIVFLVQNGMVVLTGGEAWEFDEEAVTASVVELLAVASMVITAIIGVLQLTKTGVNNIQKQPPSLNRRDYEFSRVGESK